jgi:hypothetical protein
MATAAAVPEVRSLVRGAVLVSFFDGGHKTHTTFAHILAVGQPDDNGNAALTVAFPDPNADPAVLASANWQRGYRRVPGVKHVDHPDVTAGRESIAWGGNIATAADLKGEGPQIPQPEGDASRSYLKRQVPQEVPKPSIEQNLAVQSGKAPQPTTVSPLVNEAQGQAPAAQETGPAETAGAPEADPAPETPGGEMGTAA